MTLLVDRPPVADPSSASYRRNPAQRAMIRWGWRLLRREWRQQLLVLALIVVAVGATVVGAATAVNQPPPASAGFGTATAAADFPGTDTQLASQLELLRHHVVTVDVIENQVLSIPGSLGTFDLRAQDPHGPYGSPMLSLVSGAYPIGADQAAVTQVLADELHLHVGGTWTEAGTARRIVGIVSNPQSLLDEFALVVPGQVTAPTQVVALFDATGSIPKSLRSHIVTPGTVTATNLLNPETISLTVLTIGMLLIALVAVGGFTVLAQRRLRSLGMLTSLGATDRHVRLVVRANGVAVGFIGAVGGLVLGLVLWVLYRPHLEASSHHDIGIFALPWLVVGLAVVLAVVATYVAASRPARAVTRVPVVAALSGRPAPPRQIRRSALPGIVCLVGAFLLLGYAGGTNKGGGGGGSPELVLGIAVLIPAVILLAPFCLSLLARIGRHAPLSVRLALRDLSRYRARSGSALAAISIGVLIAVIIATVAAARYGNVVDYAGPNMTSNQLVIHLRSTTTGQHASTTTGTTGSSVALPNTPSAAAAVQSQAARTIARGLDAQHLVSLDGVSALLTHLGRGRSFSGTMYVATPQLLAAFGISPSTITPNADVLTARPGLSGASNLVLRYASDAGDQHKQVVPGTTTGESRIVGQGPQPAATCEAAQDCIAHPVIQELGALPSGTSAPNTVITEHAIRSLHLHTDITGWLVQTAQPLTAAQISSAQSSAATADMFVESKNDQPTSSSIIGWATVFGILLALCILAMSVGLIRSETAGDLRTLSAAGASSGTRRKLTAATAGALGLVGGVLGTLAGYVAVIGFLRDNSLNTGISSLGNVPVTNLLIILLGMPAIAALGGYLLAGRQPSAIARRPMD